MATANTVIPPRTDDQREVDVWRRVVSEKINTKKSAARADSTAANVADLKTDFNDLLAKLRAADLLSS